MMTFSGSFKRLLCAGLLAASLPATADVPTIRVGWTIPAEEAKYWMMRRPDAFPDLGKKYKIEWVQFQGTAPMVQAMLSGALDCSSQAPLSLGQGAAASDLKAYILAQHVGEKPGSFSVYWAVPEDSPIKSIADLKGKTVGVNVYGSGVHGGMAMLLKKNGIDPEKDIKLVETGFPGSEAALRGGRVDVGVFVQPFASRAEAKGGVRKLFALSDLMPNTVHVMEVCKKDWVDANVETAKLYTRDMTAAMKMALDNRDETIKVVSEVTRAPAAALEPYLLKANDFAHDPTMKPDFAAVQTMFDMYTELGMIKKPLKVDQFRRDDVVAPVK
ncbi:PhnD/SsuA/transferrin family substrate-binding protein [Azoarcus indigens]|uniref:NitT/TauT family transport system substrate-binding protein/sulfonate transport system substrate-binding protein n=1 Tax=Azoarcus indigens TaxID=29545 RepID=A0A4R6ED50_9RHOO|nr:ABC transporter substrate-binding protein [Azoarcus indigens]NMG67611.1 PhnD/SsuA/transferrin family substrate-binding protein [Azoarcus indigens]TDN56101.1 NitT/TauT family transport system substrate-binding protein/sulfonate transport system substrate-binding protein [Azoarcus indigens]